MNATPEQWRWIPGYEGSYEVSDQGRVRSWMPWLNTTPPRILATPLCVGYPRVTLRRDGQQRCRTVHSLVMEAFVGPCPEGHEVRHLDGNRANPVLTNLAYGTAAENVRDSLRHGTQWQARKTHCPKGHPYDEANTYRGRNTSGGISRVCRACGRERRRQYVARLKARTAQ